MTSLAARYVAGEHEAVWAELDRHADWTTPISRGPGLATDFAYRRSPTPDEVEEVMRMTFERVARNVDRVIERLREVGYRFESEAGR